MMKRILTTLVLLSLSATSAAICFVSGVTDQYLAFVAVDSADFTTRETGLTTFTVTRQRNNGTVATMTTPTVTESSNTLMPGVYTLLLDEDMTIAAGNDVEEMVFHITQANMAPVTRTIELCRPKITAGNTLTVASDGDLSEVNTLTGQTVQTGDSFARLGAPAGASHAADLLAIDNFVDDLETRITAARAGYLDNLNGHVAQTGDSFARIGLNGAGLSNIDLPNQTMDITGTLSGTVGGIAGTIQTLDGFDTALDTAHGAGSWLTGGAGTGTPTLADDTAQSGTANTIVLAASEGFGDNDLDDNGICINGGTGAGQCRLIASNVGATDTVTVADNWTTNPDATSEYFITAATVNVAGWDGTPVSESLIASKDVGLVLGNNITVSTVNSQTEFVLSGGPTNDDAFNDGVTLCIEGGTEDGCEDITDWVGSTSTVTIAAPLNFTVQAGDIPRAYATGFASVSGTVSADVVSVSGDFTAANNLEADYDGSGYNKSNSTIGNATVLTNLPTIPANWLTASGIAAGAMDGKGDWNIGKTGYSLSQAFPANFADMSITASTGLVALSTLPTIPTNWLTASGIQAGALDSKGNWNIGKTGYSLTQAFPSNFADMSISATTGRVDVALIEGVDATDQINAEADAAHTTYDAPTKTEFDAGLAALNDVSTAEIVAAVLAGQVEDQGAGYDLKCALSTLLAYAAGTKTGTNTSTWSDPSGAEVRLVGTIAPATGVRSGITITCP